MRRRGPHEAAPGRNRNDAGKPTSHDRRRPIESEPDARDQMWRVADEPRIRIVIGRPRLAGCRQLESGGPRGDPVPPEITSDSMLDIRYAVVGLIACVWRSPAV